MGEFDTVMQIRDEVEDCITIKNSLNPSRGLRTMFLFCKKDAFQNMDFSCLNCQLEQKKLTQHVYKIFRVSANEELGK